MKNKCIVIGAGAAGLTAALELLTNGYEVLILEARQRIGGRIYTTHLESFSQQVETGAEFIHGDAPLTMKLLREANIQHEEVGGIPFQIRNGEISRGDFFDRDWQRLLDQMKKVEHDMPFAEFLQQYFPGDEHFALRDKVTDFVEGYNAANINTASTIALRDEWTSDEDPKQLRPIGGYGPMLEHMKSRIEMYGGIIHLGTTVHNIEWKRGSVKVFSASKSFEGSNVLITIPIGVLQKGTINFSPSIKTVSDAAKEIGFGNVIKFHFEFSAPLWASQFNKAGFIFTDADVPTWWTQQPDQVPILTGWLGGPQAEKQYTAEAWYATAMSSLEYLLNEKRASIEKYLKAWHVCDWKNDQHSFGAYSFSTLTTSRVKSFLNEPIEDTVFFAGEALHEGPQSGTVEAAIASGKGCALKMIKLQENQIKNAL